MTLPRQTPNGGLLLLKRIGGLLATATIMAVALFVPAGTLAWGAAWCYLAAYLVVLVLAAGLLLPGHRDVIAERGRGTRDAVCQDVLITRALTALTIGFLVVSGLDHRLGWTPSWPGWVTGLGFALFVAGYGIVVWAMRANRFFSQAVRIQSERDHVTVTTGPYALVRHPGYLGMVLNAFGGVLILGTLWGWVYLVAYGALVVIRTAGEDRLLQASLSGYPEYQQQTRFRLFPGIW